MTGENELENARLELARARECLIESRTLLEAALPYGAASRAYYVAFHAVRALLFSIGLEARSHRGTFSMLAEHFVRPGRFSADVARLAAHLQRDREDADYLTAVVFTTEAATTMLADAERVLAEVERLLADREPAA